MNNQALVIFLNKLETMGVISITANQKIQSHIDFNYRFSGRLFLVICGIIGALFASAGVFSIISHNWDDLPKHVRGFLSLVPSLAGLYFYYLAYFKHRGSKVWIEASSVFLMLMIGASISLVAQTYQMDGDFSKFIKVWLFLTIPLFYIGRSSGIAILYMGLNMYFVFPLIRWGFFGLPSDYDLNSQWYWFWIFFAAFIPHYIMVLNKKERFQGPRSIYLGWVIALSFYMGLPIIFQGGFIFWALTIVVGYQFLGHRYYADNYSILAKPFQFVSYFALFTSLLSLSDKYNIRQLFRQENLENFGNYDGKQQLFFVVGFLAMIAISLIAFKYSDKKTSLMRYMIMLPVLIILLMVLHYLDQVWSVDWTWLGWVIFNFYVLAFGISAMIYGSRDKKMLPMFYGLFLVCILLGLRYFDTDLSFWFKGIVFLCVGGFFFFINYVFSEDVENE